MSINSLTIPSSQHGESFAQQAITSKNMLNKELHEKNPKNKVFLLWYLFSTGSHVAIVVDDKPYGFQFGVPAQEGRSLEHLIERANTGRHSKWSAIAVQRVKVNFFQYREIQQILSRSKDSFPCGSCMDAVFKILQLAKVEISPPPFPLDQLPDVSRIALQQQREKSKTSPLGKLKYYGKCENITNEDKDRYLDNITATPFKLGVSVTAAPLLVVDTIGKVFFETPILPVSIIVPLAFGVGTLATVYTAYTAWKFFYKTPSTTH